MSTHSFSPVSIACFINFNAPLPLPISHLYHSTVSSSVEDLKFFPTVSVMAESSSASYIRLVQHLIEQCLLFHMNKDECIEALSKHANIKPVITSTVWKELEKENREFFEKYRKEQEEKALEIKAAERVEKMLAESAAKDFDKDD